MNSNSRDWVSACTTDFRVLTTPEVQAWTWIIRFGNNNIFTDNDDVSNVAISLAITPVRWFKEKRRSNGGSHVKHMHCDKKVQIISVLSTRIIYNYWWQLNSCAENAVNRTVVSVTGDLTFPPFWQSLRPTWSSLQFLPKPWCMARGAAMFFVSEEGLGKSRLLSPLNLYCSYCLPPRSYSSRDKIMIEWVRDGK